MTTPQGPQDPTSPQPSDSHAQSDLNAQSDPSSPGPSLSRPGDATSDPYGAAASGEAVDPGQYPRQGGYQQPYPQRDASAQGYPQGDLAQGGYQQPGAYPQPGGPGQYGQPGMAPVDPSAAKAKAKQRNIYIAVFAVVVIAVVAFFVIRSNNSDTANASVGDCIQVKDATNPDKPDTNQIDCSDPNAYYVVTAVGDGLTCDDGESEFTQTGSGGKNECLRPNLKQGECVKFKGAANGDFQKIDCSAATSTDVKVVLVDSTTSDKSKCPTGSQAVSLPSRNYLYCLAPAKS